MIPMDAKFLITSGRAFHNTGTKQVTDS